MKLAAEKGGSYRSFSTNTTALNIINSGSRWIYIKSEINANGNKLTKVAANSCYTILPDKSGLSKAYLNANSISVVKGASHKYELKYFHSFMN
jgi:hypothetical protein